MLQLIQNLGRYLRPPSPVPDKDKTDPKETTSIKKMSKQEVSELNEYAQKYGTNKISAKYEFTDRMVSNRKLFTATCTFEGHSTCGTATNKQEAKRLAAGEMLMYLRGKNGSRFSSAPPTPKKVQEEHVISNKLEDFDASKLNVFLDEYLDDREKDYSKFRRLFVGDMPENNGDENLRVNDGVDFKFHKSETLNKLKVAGFEEVNLTNACRLFKSIVREMKLIYYAEFMETSGNDRYIVVIKLNQHLFTFSECGATPKEAIQGACIDAIQKLVIFNH